MNLEGKIVKYNVPENDRTFNNGQETCPALVLTDWCPENPDVETKALNLKVHYDGTDAIWKSSSQHVSVTEEGSESWELYPDI